MRKFFRNFSARRKTGKYNVKSEKAAKKSNENNREGQWERKRHAKAVYGKHLQGQYLQENLYFFKLRFLTFFVNFKIDVKKQEKALKDKKQKKIVKRTPVVVGEIESKRTICISRI